MNCPYCKADWGEKKSAKFCPKCGHKIAACASCGYVFTKKVKFCPQDGTAVPEEVYNILPDAVAGAAVAKGKEAAEKAEKSAEKTEKPVKKTEKPVRKTGKSAESTEKTKKTKKKGTPVVLLILLALLLLGGIAAGAYVISQELLPFNKAAETDVDKDEDSEEIEPETAEVLSETEIEAETEIITETEIGETNENSEVSNSEIPSSTGLTWDSLVSQVREMVKKEDMVINSWGESYLSTGAGDLNNYSTASDLFITMFEDGMIEEKAVAASETSSTSGSNDYLCPELSTKNITKADFDKVAAAHTESFPGGRTLQQMMINEIYAKNGYIFSTDAVKEYFEAKDWYQEVKKNKEMSSDMKKIDQRMNKYEEANIKFLRGL